MNTFQPAYIEAFEKGILKERKELAYEKLKDCHLCPRNCGVDRTSGETGICKTGVRAVVASYAPHFGEEAPLVGRKGSGTIFFTHCNLLCNFCQNYDISHKGNGIEVSKSHLARIMLELQQMGCHNINFVTPSHVIPQILSALEIAIEHGLNIPLVYNTSGYDHIESLKFWMELLIFTCRILSFGILKLPKKRATHLIILKLLKLQLLKCTGRLVILKLLMVLRKEDCL